MTGAEAARAIGERLAGPLPYAAIEVVEAFVVNAPGVWGAGGRGARAMKPDEFGREVDTLVAGLVAAGRLDDLVRALDLDLRATALDPVALGPAGQFGRKPPLADLDAGVMAHGGPAAQRAWDEACARASAGRPRDAKKDAEAIERDVAARVESGLAGLARAKGLADALRGLAKAALGKKLMDGLDAAVAARGSEEARRAWRDAGRGAG